MVPRWCPCDTFDREESDSASSARAHQKRPRNFMNPGTLSAARCQRHAVTGSHKVGVEGNRPGRPKAAHTFWKQTWSWSIARAHLRPHQGEHASRPCHMLARLRRTAAVAGGRQSLEFIRSQCPANSQGCQAMQLFSNCMMQHSCRAASVQKPLSELHAAFRHCMVPDFQRNSLAAPEKQQQ